MTPPDIAPPSFAGMGWLLVLNLAAATLGVLVLSYAFRQTWRGWRADPDARGSAPELMRRIIGLMLAGETLRALSDALAMYGWNPAAQSSGGWGIAGRFLDPIGLGLVISGAVIWLLTEDGLMGQARTPPPFHPIWEDRETIIRMGKLAFIAVGVALCPVIFR